MVKGKIRSNSAMEEGQWYKYNTYYQILEVSPAAEDEEKREDQKISTTVVTKQRGDDYNSNKEDYFYGYLLDENTIRKLEKYPRRGDEYRISSYLPSSGIVFEKGFFKALYGYESEPNQTEITNFYSPMRTILYSRKISQLIAKTWWCYLKAKEQNLLNYFALGDWDHFTSSKDKDKDKDGLYILEGLIAREIFNFAGGSLPDYINEESINILEETKRLPADKPKMIISPTSKSWQGICLSLLLSGQAYYKTKDGKYHQISQPILSTGEIVDKYSLEVDWNRFGGDVKEILLGQEKPWVGYKVVVPYPSIPTDVEQVNLKKWADAEDDGGDLPFYSKTKDGRYLIDVQYFRAPYPYIPLSST